jgi:hypothetical protein
MHIGAASWIPFFQEAWIGIRNINFNLWANMMLTEAFLKLHLFIMSD